MKILTYIHMSGSASEILIVAYAKFKRTKTTRYKMTITIIHILNTEYSLASKYINGESVSHRTGRHDDETVRYALMS